MVVGGTIMKRSATRIPVIFNPKTGMHVDLCAYEQPRAALVQALEIENSELRRQITELLFETRALREQLNG
jgi:hypothetical protein